MLHFLDHRTREWYPAKVQSQESHGYILTTEQGCTTSHNCVDIRPTNVSFQFADYQSQVKLSCLYQRVAV